MPTTEAAILERMLEPTQPEFNRALAEYIVSLDFKPGDHARMDALSEKAHLGSLTPEEQRELDSYISMGHFLALLQSKARMTLRPSSVN